MRDDCHSYHSTCNQCKATRAKFKLHPTLHPFDKGLKPFQCWVIDLVIGLPPGTQGETICFVAVDTFSKFVVAEPIANKSSATITRVFHRRIINQYGLPQAVRCDNGTEFRGEFEVLLKSYKIFRVKSAAYYPQG